jgi:ABC-2 type transport system permease protein
VTARAGAVAPPVPVVLVRLKLRLMRNRSKHRTRGFGMVFATLGALGFGILGFVSSIGAAHTSDPRVSRAVVVIGATVVVIGWAVLPLLSFGTDETLDPARLQLLPLERRPLIAGLLAASFIGYAPFAVLLTLAGVVVGYASGVGAIITLFAVVLLAVMAAATARTLATALASTMSSRRGRDVIIAVTAVLGVSVQFVRFIHFVDIDAALLNRVSNVLRWLPPGALGQSIIDARTGHLARALVELIPALIVVPLLLALWARTLDRSLTVVTGGSTTARTAAGSGRRSSIFPRGLPFLRPNAWGAVAAKELRYVARDPRRRIVFAQLVLVGLGGPIWIAVTARSLPPGSVLIASIAGYIALIGALNQFGFDGGALWLDIVAGNGIRAELIGKNVALLIQALPVVLVGSLVLASASDGWAYIPAGLVIAAAGLGAGLGVANVLSVRYPQRIAETKSPFGGSAGGQGCVTALILLVGMFVQGLLLAPVAIAAAVCAAVAPAALVIVAPACALYGYVLWRAGTANATRWAWWRQPEILLAVDPHRGV